MRRSGYVVLVVRVCLLISSIALISGLAGCGSHGAVTTTTFAVPASITLTPSPALSMELGTNQSFTAAPQSASKGTINEPVSFQSSNTAVLTVASNGLACAGSWDSLANPQICTPGPVGVAQVTATAQGVTSPPTTVYVHQHIDNITVTQAPNQMPPTGPCFSAQGPNSKPQTYNYEAKAFSRGIDITPTVGQFTWQALNTAVVNLSSTASGLANMVNGVSLNQVQVSASVPGITPISATVGTANSVPFNFTTCPVQSISLQVTSSSSTSKTITPTVLDVQNNQLLGVPLTWSSSNPASVSASTSGVATGTSAGGGATIIASCTPPTCNIGPLRSPLFPNSLPIYPQNVVTMVLSNTGTENATIYVSSTGCGTTDNCVSTLVPITVPGNTVGAASALSATPNSLVFNRQGTKAYLGTNSGLFGSRGLMVFDPSVSSVTTFTSVPGKVLAVSPDGNKVIVSDTDPRDGPNRVFVFDTTNSPTAAFQINGATAADFSPDSLKAYIVAGSTLYVYSKLDALQTIPLLAPANDVSFLAEGAFAYVAGGNPNGTPAVTVRRTCDSQIAQDSLGNPQIIPTGATPLFIRTLPDAAHVLAVNPPVIDIISLLDSNGVSTIDAAGCAPQPAPPTVSNSLSSVNLGQNFVVQQVIISPDGATAYLVSPNLNGVLAFSISGLTSTAIPMAANATPVQASLTPDGRFLYVAGSDGTVHVLDTGAVGDVQQITFPQNFCLNSVGGPEPFTCKPNLIAVKP